MYTNADIYIDGGGDGALKTITQYTLSSKALRTDIVLAPLNAIDKASQTKRERGEERKKESFLAFNIAIDARETEVIN